MLVEDHEVDVEQLQAPVLVGAQQLADDVEVLDLVDPDEDDRQVAGDAVRPRAPGAPRSVAGEHARRRPQRRIGVEDPVGEALEEVRLVRRRCRGGGAGPGPASRRGSRPARTWPESRYLSARSSTSSRDSATTVAKIAWAVAPGASRTRRRRLKIGSSTAPTVFESGRPSMTETGDRTDRPAAEEAGAVGLVLDDAAGVAPRPPRRAPPRPAARRAERGRRVASSAPSLGDELGLDEQVLEGRVGDVGRLRRERRAPRTT